MVLLALPLLLAPVQAPIVVSPTSGGIFPLQAAVDAAPEGAVLLIEPGIYSETQISSKSLTLVGMGAGPDEVILSALPFQFGSGPGLSISGLSAGQSVDLSNLTITSPEFGALVLSQNDGSIVISDAEVVGRTAELFGSPGVSIVNSSSVWFDRVRVSQEVGGLAFGGVEPTLDVQGSTVIFTGSTVEGLGSAGTGTFDGATALSASSSTLAFFDTRIVGGDAEAASGPFGPPAASEGGVALELIDSDARWGAGSGNELQGGGGFADPGGGVGPGASAVTLVGAASFVSDAAAVISAGVDSDGGVTAPAIDPGSGSVSLSPVLIPRIEFNGSQALPGDTVSATLSGEAGSLLFPRFQLGQTAAVTLPGFEGVALIDPLSAGSLPLQVLDGSGAGLLSGALPANPSLAGTRLVIQGLQIAPLGLPQVSAPSGLVVQF